MDKQTDQPGADRGVGKLGAFSSVTPAFCAKGKKAPHMIFVKAPHVISKAPQLNFFSLFAPATNQTTNKHQTDERFMGVRKILLDHFIYSGYSIFFQRNHHLS